MRTEKMEEKKKDASDVIQLILRKEQVEQIIDSLQKTGRMDLAAKMAGLMPKKPEMEFPFELESGKGENICEAKGCMVYVSGKSREESLNRYAHVFCGNVSEGHIGDIERGRKKEEAEKKLEKEVDKGPILGLPPGAEIKIEPEKHKKVVQKHLPILGELPDKCEKCGKTVPVSRRGFIYGKTGHVYCDDCDEGAKA
ncbi:unnamed protein product [marine sediment metagenome]|uniref:Uncharacterized protein n=1 Tax=marine sediment metagenome TaxID=412755 RepID=X1PZN4_9ZZZZ